jgi:peroxiredoxin Q/BCP
MLVVGTQAPDFTIRDHLGQDVSLSALEGHIVVLWFYPKADTPG